MSVADVESSRQLAGPTPDPFQPVAEKFNGFIDRVLEGKDEGVVVFRNHTEAEFGTGDVVVFVGKDEASPDNLTSVMYLCVRGMYRELNREEYGPDSNWDNATQVVEGEKTINMLIDSAKDPVLNSIDMAIKAQAFEQTLRAGS